MIIRNHNKSLEGEFIGSVEYVIGSYVDMDGSREYVTDLSLAFQLAAGPILLADETPEGYVISSIPPMSTIHWGYYPLDFPEQMKTTRRCPKILRRFGEIFPGEEGYNEYINEQLEDLPI